MRQVFINALKKEVEDLNKWYDSFNQQKANALNELESVQATLSKVTKQIKLIQALLDSDDGK